MKILKANIVTLIAALTLACLFAFGCGDKKEQPQTQTVEEAGTIEDQSPPTWEGTYRCSREDSECRDDKHNVDGIYYVGTVYNTIVNSDVNMRSLPSTRGVVLGQVTKDTRVQILGVSRDGWAYITTREVIPRRGWVSGQFVDYDGGEKLAPVSELNVADFRLIERDSSVAEVTVSYKIDGANPESANRDLMVLCEINLETGDRRISGNHYMYK